MEGTERGVDEGSLLQLAAEPGRFADALAATLRVACTSGDWAYGEAWLYQGGELVTGAVYDPTSRFTAFTETSADVTNPDAGLVGRVVASGAVVWLDDLGDSDGREQTATDTGLASAVGVPVVAEDAGVVAVLTFYATERRTADEAFVTAVADAVTTFGGLFGRSGAEQGTDHEAELEEKTRQLESFASVLSHDIRSPLAVASGFLELARETGDLSYLEKVERSHERIEELVDTLLVLARKGRMVGKQEPVDLAATAREAWAGTKTKDATLDVGDVGHVEADAARLRQVFENLFRNSVQHAAPDAAVSVRPLDGEPGFAVEDDGPGIPAEKRAEMLRPGHESAGGGFGLGLSIVAAVAEGHEWDLRLTAGEAGGARFEFRPSADEADAVGGE